MPQYRITSIFINAHHHIQISKWKHKNINFHSQYTILNYLSIYLSYSIKMEEQKKANSIYYAERPHHRQQLRQHILPSTIDMLEVNENPSTVTRKACQSLYQDQLEKEVAARSMAKGQAGGGEQGRTTTKGKANSIYQQGRGAGDGNFRDYDREKVQRISQHVNANYDGGSSFFRASQEHQNMRVRQLKQMGMTLQAQINTKMLQIDHTRTKKQLQNQARTRQQQHLHQLTLQQRQQATRLKQNLSSTYMRQMEQEKLRKKDRDLFMYKNEARHNPITNPIEYHIENPYILKQIQDNKMGVGKGESRVRY